MEDMDDEELRKQLKERLDQLSEEELRMAMDYAIQLCKEYGVELDEEFLVDDFDYEQARRDEEYERVSRIPSDVVLKKFGLTEEDLK